MHIVSIKNILLLSISTPTILFSQNNSERPNIIFILADDLGYSDLGCYGGQIIKTPNIDKLASEGIKFTNHYAGTSVSAPSRCSLITGLDNGHTQVRGNLNAKPYGQIPLKEGTVTVASKLKEAGYKTALIGKWGLGVENTSGDPQRLGFDYAFGYLCQVLAHNHYPEYLMENGKKFMLHNKVQYLKDHVYSSGMASFPIEKKEFSQDLFTSKALQFIDQQTDNPFFIYFAVVLPHDNSDVPIEKRYSDIPSFAPYETKNWTEAEKGYAAMVTYLDNEVGKIVEKLKQKGLDKNTLIVFTSDNGGDSPGMFKSISNKPYRGLKRDLYEGGIRVPFIAKWPERIKPNTVSNHVAAFWDFLPTVCDITHTKLTSYTNGISYVPALEGKKQTNHKSLYFEFHEQGGKQAIIQGNWKCIRLNIFTPENEKVELYNIANDSTETFDLSKQYPNRVKKMLKSMALSRTENENFKMIIDRDKHVTKVY